MLRIYLDESYNLKDRSRKQFISINGFMVLDDKEVFKKWKEFCQSFLKKKRRIHAVDSEFVQLREKVLKLIQRPDIALLTVFQVIQEIPFEHDKAYFIKDKLNFDKVYLDLLKALFKELKLGEYREVKIIIDSRKHKGGILAKKKFREEIIKFLSDEFPKTKVVFKIQPSSIDVLLELADFVSNIFYRAYQEENTKLFKDLQFKLFQIKNPLK